MRTILSVGLSLALLLVPGEAVQAEEKNIDKLLYNAKELSLKGRFANSRKLYQKVIDEFPMEVHDQALFWLAFTYEAEGITQQAVPLYEQLVGKFPQSIYADDALRKLAGIHRASGDSLEAVRALRTLSKDHPDSPYANEALLELGDLFGYELHEFNEAVSSYRSYDPSDAVKLEVDWKIQFFENNNDYEGKPIKEYFSSYRQWTNKSFDAAEKVLNTLILSYPNSQVVDDALLLLGRIEIDRALELKGEAPLFLADEKIFKHYDRAAGYFTQVVRDYPKSAAAAEGLFRLGLINDWEKLGGLNDFERARKEYQKVVERYPGTYWAQRAEERLETLARIF